MHMLRGGETSRIEAFSDGVYAFALTLLVVSLEVPRSYDELIETTCGFPAFDPPAELPRL